MIALYSILLSSCARERLIENISFPSVESKAAVYCILTPGDSIFVALKTVQTINSQSANGTKDITDARVALEDKTTGQRVTLLATRRSGLYSCAQRNFPIQPGHTYHLLVSASYLDTMEASCQIPLRTAKIDTIAYGEPYQDSFIKQRRVALTWLDVSDSAMHYDYFISSQYLYQNSTLTNTSFDNSLITQVGNQLYYNDDTIDSGTPHTYYLFTTDPNLYTFFTIAQRIGNVSGGNASDFFGGYLGITPTFTNIRNGYGIFGGYLKTSKTISFP